MARQKGLQLLETLTQAEQEKCETPEGLFSTLNGKFKPWYSETIKSLQFCKLVRHSNESAEEWMDRLRIATAECIYKEQFTHGLNDHDMIEILKKLTKTEKIENVTSEQILVWAKRVETQKHNQPY